EHLDSRFETEAQVCEVDELSDTFLLQQAIDERHALRKRVVEDDASDSRVQVLTLVVRRFGVKNVLIVIRVREVNNLAGVTQTNRSKRLHFLGFEREQHVFDRRECTAFALRARTPFGQVIETEHHVLSGNSDWLSRGGRQDVVRREHQHAGFNLGFRRERNVNRHLVAVEVGIESCADERVNLNGLAFHQHRLKGLNAKSVKRWSAVQKHRVILNNFFKDVPYRRLLLFDHFFCLLDGRALPSLLQTVIDERFEQLERHLLRQAALVQFQFGTDDDHRTSRVVHALSEQILAEASLFALERVRERLQGTIVRAA